MAGGWTAIAFVGASCALMLAGVLVGNVTLVRAGGACSVASAISLMTMALRALKSVPGTRVIGSERLVTIAPGGAADSGSE